MDQTASSAAEQMWRKWLLDVFWQDSFGAIAELRGELSE